MKLKHQNKIKFISGPHKGKFGTYSSENENNYFINIESTNIVVILNKNNLKYMIDIL
jgi:ribosomal protein L24